MHDSEGFKLCVLKDYFWEGLEIELMTINLPVSFMVSVQYQFFLVKE